MIIKSRQFIPIPMRYLFAALVCIPALAIAMVYSPLANQEFLFALFAVALSSWIGGMGPGVCTTTLMILGVNFLVWDTTPDVRHTVISAIQSLAFGLLGVIISWLEDRQIRIQLQLTETQSLMRAVLENLADGITAQDKNRQPIFANTAAATLTGFRTGMEFVDTPVAKFWSDFKAYDTQGQQLSFEDLPSNQALNRRVPTEQTYRSVNTTLNTSRWLNHRATPVLDNNGDIRYVVNILRDVSADFQREEKLTHLLNLLEEQNHRYQAILNNIPGVVWEVKGSPAQGQIPHFISPYIQTMLGYTPEEIISHPERWDALLPEEDRAHLIQIAAEMYEKQDYGRMTYHWIAKDKRLVDVESFTTINRDREGNVISVYGVTMDISARTESEAAITRYTEDLKNANEELRLFAYITSHDLQEPLRMISSYLELLRQRYAGQLDATADEFISFAVDGAARMKTLLSDLLSYARAGSKESARDAVDVGKVLRIVQRNLSIQIEETDAVITYRDMPTITADEQQITQVFQNLVSNAIKFRSPDAAPRIHISAQHTAHGWRFTVQDNGIGIDKKHWDRIFLIFQRLHTRTEFEGTGIGLAICKKIVERYHGTIGVESEPGKGSTFYFTIPEVLV